MSQTETAEPVKDYYKPLEEHEEGVAEGAVTVINTAEINQQIATAHRFPRSIHNFRRRMFEMVTIDIDTAESCIYALPRDGKMIDGPSIRFAELLLVAWGNNRAACEVTEVGDEYVTSMGAFLDLEANSAIQAKIMRRIVTSERRDKKTGETIPARRYSVDMIATTGNAAASIALRNAILRGVPKALWKDLFDEAKRVAAGTQQTFAQRRERVMKELGIQGATPEQIFLLLGVKGLDDIKTEHVVHLRGLSNAIRDNEITVEDAFKPGLAPGQVAPEAPKRSDFDRDPSKQQPASEQGNDQQRQAESANRAQEGKKPEQTEQRDTKTTAPVAGDDEVMRDFLKDALSELTGVKSMRDIPEIRERIGEQLGGAMLEEWMAACKTRGDDIIAGVKNKGKK